jgi:hypothetical protein
VTSNSFEDGPDVFGAYASLSEQETAQPIDFDYTSLVTSAWAAGGIVSPAPDLHALFMAVFDGQVVSPTSLSARRHLKQELSGDARSGTGSR